MIKDDHLGSGYFSIPYPESDPDPWVKIAILDPDPQHCIMHNVFIDPFDDIWSFCRRSASPITSVLLFPVEVSPDSIVADGLGVIQNMSQIKDDRKGTKATEQGPPSSVEGGRKEPAVPEAPEENKDGADVGNAAVPEKEVKEKEDDKEEKKGKDKAEETVSQYLYVFRIYQVVLLRNRK
jgi:hypothetical protein